MRMFGAIAIVGVLLAGCGDADAPPPPATTPSAEAPPITASGDEITYRAEQIDSYDRPVWVGSPPGDLRIFVVEQHTATIRVLGEDAPFLTLPDPVATGGEQGLLGLAFHPDFTANGRYFVNFTNRDGRTKVVEFHEGDPAAVQTWLEVGQPYENHNGGHVAFGPDGRLYVGMGDGGAGGDPENRAQDNASPLGKLLAIDVDHPEARVQQVAKGLRNPWRFSFSDDGTRLWIGDVGQDEWEEIDRVPFPLPEGANFGWRLLEGNHRFADGGDEPEGYIAPVYEYSRDDGCSVTGGVEVAGGYLFGDYCSSRYWLMSGDQVTEVPIGVPAPTHFATRPDGTFLIASGDGWIYRVTP